MSTLYEISDDMAALSSLLFEQGGEIVDEIQEQILDQWFAELGQARDEKIDGYCALMREKEARAEIRRQEAARLLERARVEEAQSERLKARLQRFFEQHGIKKLQTKRFDLTLANNGGKAPLVVNWNDPSEALPEQYQRKKVEMDKDAIRRDLESGTVLEWAEIGERGRHLKIK